MNRSQRQAFLSALLLFSLATGHQISLAAGLGDRLVVAINNVSYTQRQIEVYITVKEGLRKERRQVRLIRPQDWSEAIDVFNQDMIVLQEALRLGSFKPDQEVVRKLAKVIQRRRTQDKNFHNELQRLGVADEDLNDALADIVRVESFRKNREQLGEKKSSAAKTSPWVLDLLQRAVVRLYEGAKEYRRLVSWNQP